MDKKDKKNFEVVQIPTQTEPKIKDNETGENYSLIEAVCVMWEELRDLRKAIG
ncbi:hypothetical protein LCGC14_2777720 [marine sediment metagenome]|uniref:Uncharacterized protein n=1 Tax=marine sediment metagenome TaxID=412755 RepID=A0A0F8ZG91_9ZZZZ